MYHGILTIAIHTIYLSDIEVDTNQTVKVYLLEGQGNDDSNIMLLNMT